MNLRPMYRFLVIALFVLASAATAHGTTYYVAVNGNDSNNCKSSALACHTISHAASLATAPGDIVQVAPGTYTGAVSLTKSGSANGVITFRGQTGSGCPTSTVTDVNSPTGTHPASQVILTGGITIGANYLTIDCFHLKGSSGVSVQAGISHVSITNNEIEGTGTTGGGIYFNGVGSVKAAQYANNITISRNYIHAVSNGIFLVCSSCVISDNEITALVGDEPGSDHDYIDAWGVGSTIRHNYMHANTCNACNGYDCHMDCVQTWNTTGDGTEVSQNMTIDRNVCFNHHEGVIVQDNGGNGDVSNWTLTNNVFAYPPSDDGSGHLCQAGPVHPWCWVFEDGNLGKNNVFANNTCIDGSEGFRTNAGSAEYKNNLYLSLGSQTTMYSNAGAQTNGSNNLYFAVAGSFSSAPYPADIVNKDPKIVSAGTSTSRCDGCNFDIQSTSAAKDTGTPTGISVDLLGNPRPLGSAFDIGAYEFVPTTQPGTPTGLTGTVK